MTTMVRLSLAVKHVAMFVTRIASLNEWPLFPNGLS